MLPAKIESATPGRMRVVTSAAENPQRGARPTMSSRSGKPLKKRAKKPSQAPGTNHRERPTLSLGGCTGGSATVADTSGGSVAKTEFSQPLAIGDGSAVRTKI